ncbi:hypothetical protein [Streptomyces sp. NPDC006551]|uniref:hypothetical protein n=1 Tax=Streptomyces sp. NPDC006551 TaxID=3157178 RepID=UPI0033BA4F95
MHALYKWFPPERRALPSALQIGGAALGTLIAAPVIWLIDGFGRRSTYAVLAVVSATWALLSWRVGHDGPYDHKHTATESGGLRLPYREILLTGTVLGSIARAFGAAWALPQPRRAARLLRDTDGHVRGGLRDRHQCHVRLRSRAAAGGLTVRGRAEIPWREQPLVERGGAESRRVRGGMRDGGVPVYRRVRSAARTDRAGLRRHRDRHPPSLHDDRGGRPPCPARRRVRHRRWRGVPGARWSAAVRRPRPATTRTGTPVRGRRSAASVRRSRHAHGPG